MERVWATSSVCSRSCRSREANRTPSIKFYGQKHDTTAITILALFTELSVSGRPNASAVADRSLDGHFEQNEVTMKAKLDFEAKTIELDGEPTLEDVHQLQASLKDWKEWRIVGATNTVYIPSLPYIQPYNPYLATPNYPTYTPLTWTYKDTTGKQYSGVYQAEN